MTISEHELWACASEVLRIHGERAPLHVADRIGDLARKGDAAGIAVWKQIALKLDGLRPPAGDQLG